ncbi:MAG: ferredoxin-NADPH reductase [Actinobacteria bacterium]|nr:ferredoxin-NADPH reductase [Actinomycetota bacterium]
MKDPAIWWYVTRSSAIIAWALMVISVTWGILLSTRVMKPKDNPSWLLDLHRWLSGLSVVFVGIHMASLFVDKYAAFSLQDLFIPFHSQYQKIAWLGGWPVALGVICTYILFAVQATSLMMKKLPRKYWKAIHYSSYALVLLVSFHAGWSGTDVRAWAYRITALVLITLTTVALITRILFPKSAKTLSATVEGRRANQNKENLHKVLVDRVTPLADGILGLDFVRPDRSNLDPWVPGAHITLHLPDGMQRQYSLCGDPADRSQYSIAVLESPTSRGGSHYVHHNLKSGMNLEVSGPHNHFELEASNEYLFIAGGIGITPIKAMIESLPNRRHWRLLYAGRSRTSMAYANELSEMFGDRVIIHADDEQGGRPNLDALPEPLLDALSSKVSVDRLHYERFSAVDRSDDAIVEAFEVTLSRSDKKILVGKDESLLDALNENGGALISSCGEGVCGTCEVRVLKGQPMHLDSVMSDEDKDAIGVMYPCVSRSTGSTLVLDI